MGKNFIIIGLSAFTLFVGVVALLNIDTDKTVNTPSMDALIMEEHEILEAYVVFQKPCPPCPKGVMCKPCVAKWIGVTVEKGSEEYIILITDTPEVFEIGNRYRFTIQNKNPPNYASYKEIVGYK